VSPDSHFSNDAGLGKESYMKKWFSYLKQGFKDFGDDECMVSGAALAYYTIFSLPPLLVMVLFIAGLFGVSREKIDRVVEKQMGVPAAQPLSHSGQQDGGQQPAGQADRDNGEQAGAENSVADRISGEDSKLAGLSPVSKVVGIVLLVFSATGLFVQLQHAMNRAWEVEPDPAQGGIVKHRSRNNCRI
jgi:membrane protein